MAPIPEHELVRRNSSADGHFAVIFAVLGSVILVSCVLWGYIIPKWQAKHRKPVQTRYNGIGQTSSRHKASKHDFELPIIFPPHPAVMIPIARDRTSKGSPCRHKLAPIPVYDPRTQSPFPNNGSWRPMTLDIPTRKSSKDINLHAARLQQSAYLKSPDPPHGYTFSDTPNNVATDAKIGQAQHKSVRTGPSRFFVARSAGAPPPKRKLVRPASEGSQCQITNQGRPHLLPTSGSSYPNATHSQLPLRRNISHRFLGDPRLDEKDVSSDRKPAVWNGTSKLLHTPGQGSSSVRNIFETPSSPAKAPTTQFGSTPSHLNVNSTPLIAPNSAAVRTNGKPGTYPGSSKLVASRRFKKYDSVPNGRHSPCTDFESEANLSLSPDDRRHSTHTMRIGHRPVSGILNEN